VDQHLVDDQLEEDRAYQPHDLKEEGRDQNITQRAAISHQRRDEPADVEGARDARHLFARGQQQDLAAQSVAGFGLAPDVRTLGARSLDEESRFLALCVRLE
jgi:hypothetical protein